ncbi:HNH endonuclease signature motif containing protein [Curtobacterium sp. SORGH_AS_0776]|uniref:HNH endonuclease signature motif containing protein n=1 Tax=Curtobacterium sp. SORGH_AS_0776 TaxID=3041798 RepID=UPI00285CE2F9|nr:HNH endonuclease signature motif containing protein [Curtobacterium sp. SORGH_AS_0776]MDR6172619.1 hypothetical protein [Curtobacterium sp. SORGH_AS_0776]
MGLCNAHYARQRLGRPMEPPVRNARATDAERFWSKVDKTGECWLWRGATMSRYGIFRLNSRNHVAHRVAFMWEHGPIPHGAEVDHMCFNRSCVRPSHLRLLDHQKNGQNRSSANSNSKTGVRGVYWNEARKGYMAAASVRDRIYRMGPFPTVNEAEAAIVAWRRDNMPASIHDQRKAG